MSQAAYDLVTSDATITPGVSQRTGSTTTYEHGDIKNRVAQTSSSQSVSATKTYDAFGNVASSSGTWGGPFSYGGTFGYQSDGDSGLMLLGHRYYDASTGRFISNDPIGDGRNWYGYAASSPVTYADPDGKVVVFVLLGVVALAGIGAMVMKLDDIARRARESGRRKDRAFENHDLAGYERERELTRQLVEETRQIADTEARGR